MNACQTCKYRQAHGYECEDCQYRRYRKAGRRSDILEVWKETAALTRNMPVRRVFLPSPEGDPVRELHRLNVELSEIARIG